MGLRDSLLDLVPRNNVERIMATSSFVNAAGNGLFSVTSALFFTRIVGIAPIQLGFAFSTAAIVGLTTTLPMGHLADRISPKTLNVRLSLLSAFGMALYAAATTYAWFFLVAILLAVTDQGGRAARNTLMARVGGPDGRVRIRAYTRAVVNLGIGAGSLLGGVALAVDDATFYRALIVLNALSTLASAFMLQRLPDIAPVRGDVKPRRTEALRDRTYVALSALNMVLSMHFMLLELIVPLWIANHTSAPRWVAAGTYLVNTAACVLFQVRMSRGAEDTSVAARMQRTGGIWLGVGMLVYASASFFREPWAAAAVMLLAAGVEVFGELKQSSGSFGIGFNLPPEHLQGQYQAVWSLSWSFGAIIGPTWLTFLAFHVGVLGWAVLCAQFVIGGLVTPGLVARALADPRRRAVQ